MRRTAIPAALGLTVALGILAAPASAAPCPNIRAEARGLDDGAPVPTGHSTTALTISGQYEGAISNVVASVPAPGSAQATLTAPGRVMLALNLPSAGSVTLTLSWDEVTPDGPCTQTTRIVLRAVRPAAIGAVGKGTGFENGIVARFSFGGCRALLLATPVTVTVRYRLGPVRPATTRPLLTPPAPTARSPKLVLVLPRPCAEFLPTRRVALPAASVRAGRSSESQFEVAAQRRFTGRGAYAAHLRVEFAQPGFRTVRFDVTGRFILGAGGKSSSTTVQRLR